VLQPEYSRFITPGLESVIYQVIEQLVNTIGSPQIAIDERHTPMLYSRFLARMLTKNTRHCTGVPHSVALNSEPTVTQTRSSDTANNNERVFERKRKQKKIDNEPIHPFDAPSYTSVPTASQPSDAMGSTFDSILSDDLLGPMNAIENPQWMQTMMLPGFVLF
jgi:hypothetical protein